MRRRSPLSKETRFVRDADLGELVRAAEGMFYENYCEHDQDTRIVNVL